MSLPVDFEGWKFSTDEEFKSLGRVVLRYITLVYDIDTDLSVVLYYKRGDEGNWLNSATYTLGKDKKREKIILPPSLSVIDYYPRIFGNYTENCKISSFKVHFKPVAVGKFG